MGFELDLKFELWVLDFVFVTIGIDLRVLARGLRSGIEVSTAALVEELLRRYPDTSFRLFYNAFKKVPLPDAFSGFSHCEIREGSLPNRLLEWGGKVCGQPTLDRFFCGCDVIVSPHFIRLPLAQSIPRVLVLHDLSFLRFPEFFSFRKRHWHWLMDPVSQARAADMVIAVSESTKRDAQELCGIPEYRIEVVYHGIAHTRFTPLEKSDAQVVAVQKKYRLPERFILFLGTLEPRKNIVGLVKAFGLLLEFQIQDSRFRIPSLVLAGPRGWNNAEIFQAISRSKARQYIHYIGFVPEEDKPALYNLAELFVYPSFFEGFGLPPLEAMACGVPVITSRNSSLPEVVGEGALMVDPHNVAELADAMALLLREEAVRAHFRKKGIAQAKKFSWGKTADETMAVLKGIARL